MKVETDIFFRIVMYSTVKFIFEKEKKFRVGIWFYILVV